MVRYIIHLKDFESKETDILFIKELVSTDNLDITKLKRVAINLIGDSIIFRVVGHIIFGEEYELLFVCSLEEIINFDKWHEYLLISDHHLKIVKGLEELDVTYINPDITYIMYDNFKDAGFPDPHDLLSCDSLPAYPTYVWEEKEIINEFGLEEFKNNI